MSPRSAERASRVPRAVLAAFSALALSSCIGQKDILPDFSIAQAPAAEAPDSGSAAGTQRDKNISPEPCSPYEALPGEYFRKENAGKIEQQLLFLERLKHGTEPVTVSSFQSGGEIVEDSLRDPWYAEAMANAVASVDNGVRVNVNQFLASEVSELELCDDQILRQEDARRHLRDSLFISGYFIEKTVESNRGPADEHTRIAVAAAVELYESIERDLRRLP